MANSNDTVTSKEAAFMLDTDMDQDMQSYKDEITLHVIKTINKNPKIYSFVKDNLKYKMSIKDSCTTWANNHSQEFGDLFITELEDVDWQKVWSKV